MRVPREVAFTCLRIKPTACSGSPEGFWLAIWLQELHSVLTHQHFMSKGEKEIVTNVHGRKMDDLLDGSSEKAEKRAKTISTDSINQTKNVYVWDMDETLILLKSLLTKTYAESFGGLKDVQKGIEIGKKWENYILQVCDEHFFYEQIETYTKPFLDAFSEYDDGLDLSDYDFSKDNLGPPLDDHNKAKLAYRYRFIAHKYSQGLGNVFDQGTMKKWQELYELTDSYTDGWLSSARAFLEQSLRGNRVLSSHFASPDGTPDSAETKNQDIHVLVTSGSLVPSLVKCMLFRLDDLIMHQNVYSSWDVGKPKCFSWIKERFDGPNVRFCVIGDGWEECEAAQAMRWPFVKIDFRPGSTHRFPGLSLRTVGHYIGVVYDPRDAEVDKQ